MPTCLQVPSQPWQPRSLASSFLNLHSLNETSIKTTNNAFVQVPGTPDLFVFPKRNETFSALTGLQLPGHSPGMNLKNTNKMHLLFPNPFPSSSRGPREAQCSLCTTCKKTFNSSCCFPGWRSAPAFVYKYYPGTGGRMGCKHKLQHPSVLLMGRGGVREEQAPSS